MSRDTKEAEWSFLTFCRLRPPSLQTLSQPDKDQLITQYRVTDGGESNGDKDNRSCKIVSLEIPQDADPGLIHNNPSGFVSFSFNEVFDIDATQEDVFNKIQPMVQDIFNGMNSTVLAYGQTGSGKTYSICGGNTYGERGLIPRSVSMVFDELATRREESNSEIRYKVLVSFTEVFGESLYDLLDPMKRNLPLEEWQKIQVLEGDDGLILRNINVFDVTTEEEVLNLFFMGTTNRVISSTKMNEASSRSHAIFTIVVETEEIIGNRKTYSAGKINLVDLAGSERLYKVNNSRSSIKEGKSINLSLHYLEQVIISLRDSQQRLPVPSRSTRRASTRGSIIGHMGCHIPYRNSVLTNILRDSLGGNCKSCFLLTLSTEVECFEESVSTCRFGQRCGEIQVKVHANLEVDVHSQLREARHRVHQLQQRVNQLEEEQLSLQRVIDKKESQLEHASNTDRLLSIQEEHECDNVLRTLCDTPAGFTDIDKITLDNLREMPRVALINVISGMTMRINELIHTQRDSITEATVESSRARAMLEHNDSTWSMSGDGDKIQEEECKTEKSDENLSRFSFPPSPSRQGQSDDFSSIDNKHHDVTALITQSKRVRQLVEGVTVITYGRFGTTKTKILSLSPDLRQLIWRDILNDTTKQEDVSEYHGYVVTDVKPSGVIVKYEHNSKSKKMEFPRNNLKPEEMRNRVLKYIALLNSLRETSAS